MRKLADPSRRADHRSSEVSRGSSVGQIDAGAIEATMADYAAAVLDKDPSRLAALYAPDVRVFDAWGVWSFEDRDAWARNVREWLLSLGDEGVRVRFEDVRSARRSSTAWASATVIYGAVDAAGQTVRSMENRLSWVLVNEGGRWLIVHEHSSAPIGFEDRRAILSRR